MNKLFIIKLILYSIFQSFTSIGFSQEIEQIILNGNNKTDRELILKEITFKENSIFSESEKERSLKRLKKMGLFSAIKIEKKIVNDDKVNVIIELQEKWTTIPILKFSSGGGLSQTTIGVYDPHLWGKYIELGGQYEKLGTSSSGVLWYKQPRLFPNRMGIGLQLWSQSRLRVKYDQNLEDKKIIHGFLHKRNKIYFETFKEYGDYIKIRGVLEYHGDSFSRDQLTDEVKTISAGKELPAGTNIFLYSLGLDYSDIESFSEILRGFQASIDIQWADVREPKALDSFLQSDLMILYYKDWQSRWNWAQRIQLGTTSTEILQYWNYLGGLKSIRGFADNRFAGRYYWLSNSEMRYTLIKKNTSILQLVAFYDLVSVAENWKRLDTSSGSSTGMGVRWMLPRVYRLVLRADYAVTLKRKDDQSLSFGVQQFF